MNPLKKNNTLILCLLAACISPLLNTLSHAGNELDVLPQKVNGENTHDMMKNYLLEEAQTCFDQWRHQYELRKSPEQIRHYQQKLNGKFLHAIGGLPEKSPLNPQITGIIERDGYHVEKIIFESRPRHYVTALLFLPDAHNYSPPYPGILVPCGHSPIAKAHPPYQTMAALLALNGMAALVFDPIDQGERGQILNNNNSIKYHCTRGHTMLGVGSILLGRNTAQFEIFDGIRAIDYLISRPEVDPDRIGITGNSGGGTQTAYLMALDDRIKAAAPSCYITSFPKLLKTIGPQDAEQNIHAQLAFNMDHPDYLMMRAPTPILICAATNDFFDIEGTWQTFRYAKRLYSRMGFAERIDLLENDAPHNYNKLQRESAAKWLSRWLLKKDKPIHEPQIKLLENKQTQCTPKGQVMLIENARSAYDLNRNFNKQIAEKRTKMWQNQTANTMLEKVRQIVNVRKPDDLPRPSVSILETISRKNYKIDKLIIRPEPRIYLPALLFQPQKNSKQTAVLYLNENGKNQDATPGGPVEILLEKGHTVLAVDIRGIGETKQTEPKTWKSHFSTDWKDFFAAYLLGRSYVGIRTEDIIICARWLKHKTGHTPDLIATGILTVPALHAAALQKELFRNVTLKHHLVSWSNIIELSESRNQLINAVHAALITYDLDNLAETIGPRLTVEQPLDALNRPVETK